MILRFPARFCNELFRKTEHLAGRQMWIPDDRNLYKLLTDWGGLVGGVFALIAGLVAYRAGQHQAKATLDAARDQIAADVEKDRSPSARLSRRDLPGTSSGRTENRTSGKNHNRQLSNKRRILATISIFSLGNRRTFGELKVVEPPLIRENGHRLFVMGEAGATIFQLLGVISENTTAWSKRLSLKQRKVTPASMIYLVIWR